jgi:hypothetical protein
MDITHNLFLRNIFEGQSEHDFGFRESDDCWLMAERIVTFAKAWHLAAEASLILSAIGSFTPCVIPIGIDPFEILNLCPIWDLPVPVSTSRQTWQGFHHRRRVFNVVDLYLYHVRELTAVHTDEDRSVADILHLVIIRLICRDPLDQYDKC